MFDTFMNGLAKGVNPDYARRLNQDAILQQQQAYKNAALQEQRAFDQGQTNARQKVFGDLVGEVGTPGNINSSASPALNMQPIMQDPNNPTGDWINNPKFIRKTGSGLLGGEFDREGLFARALGNAQTPEGFDLASKGFLDPNKGQSKNTPTSNMKEYGLYKQQGGKNSFVDYVTSLKRAGANNVRVDTGIKFPKGRMLSENENNSFGLPSNARYWLKGDGSQPQKVGDFSGEQAKIANFANQMIESGNKLSEMENSGYMPGALDQLDQIGISSAIAGTIRDKKAQAYEAYKKEWIAAHLRKDSGAAISADDQQIANEKYFPLPGNSPETIKIKQDARRREEQGSVNISSGAYEKFFGKNQNNDKKEEPVVKKKTNRTIHWDDMK